MKLNAGFSTTGLLVGTLFFAFSLTPPLLPRSEFLQGVIAGLSLAAGYAAGVFGYWLWTYLELPTPNRKTQFYLRLSSAAICGLTAVAFLWQASGWQNSIRSLMAMEETAAVRPLVVGAAALLLFVGLLLVARLFRQTWRFLSLRLQHFIPRRISQVLGLLVAFILFWSLINGVILRLALRAADRSYQKIDALLEPEIERPIHPLKTGSAESLIDWVDLGRQGRRFISSGPTAGHMAAIMPTDRVMEPLRVYVGLNSAGNPETRARLALQEMLRVYAFARSVLVLITPTGTGWVDPAAIDTFEHLHRGDIASVAVQYSYLSSPLSLLIEPEYGVETAQALFEAVYGHWSELPQDRRPALYLHGLSLGAMNSSLSFELFDIIDDPFQGALWSGPPFRTETWRTVTRRRDPGSPAWLPSFRGGQVVRFANQQTGRNLSDGDWRNFRIVFLQYASDPIVFFEPESFYRRPEWLNEPRGPDVSPGLRWFPIVTALQLAADMAAGTSPIGYGHLYAPEHYLDAWVALTEPAGWDEAALQQLREILAGAR
ncbi:MAG TPA: alpha/beta hydrolase [Desulfobacterales bacterium]